MYYQLQYYYDNKEEIRAKDNTPEAKAKRKVYFAKWYAKNKAKLLAKKIKVKMSPPPKVVKPKLEIKEEEKAVKQEIVNSGPRIVTWN